MTSFLRLLLFYGSVFCFLAAASQPTLTETHRSENLLRNGAFMARDPQQRPLHWFTGTGLQTSTITNQQRHGLQPDDLSLRFSDSSSSSDLVLRSQKHIAVPGVTYTAIAWVKYKDGKPARLLLEFWDQNNKRIGVNGVFVAADTAWAVYTIANKAPDQTTHVTVAVVSDKEGVGTSYWDDMSLQYEFIYTKTLKKNVSELFLDDYRLESMNEVQRLVHPAEKSKPLLKPTEPWEGNAVYIYGTVLKNTPAGNKYRMWYTAYLDGEYYLCYATSLDGITWKKPRLGVFDFKGSKENNICLRGGGTLVYDKDEKDNDRRYKLMSVSKLDSGKKFGYGVWFSPDGCHWKAYEGNPVITYADVSNVAYDENEKLFMATTKQRMLVSNTSVTPNKMDRAAFVSVSKDFIHWQAPEAPGSQWSLAVEGDAVDDWTVQAKGGLEGQIYGMTLYPYEGVYIGLPWCFDVMNYNNGVYAGYGDGPIQPQLAVSRDLKHWDRPVRDPVIPLGKAGAWDDGTLYTSTTMQVDEKKITLYYGAMNLPHGGDKGTQKQMAQIARATWRRDGFVSLHNEGGDTGVVITKPFIVGGKNLVVNAKLFTQGMLKIEVLDAAGKPLSGYVLADAVPITGDNYAVTARWRKQGIGGVEKKEIRLKFYLKGGDLYSYKFKD